MTEEAITTHHAQQRTKDRLGLSKSLADKKAQEALDHGIKHTDTTGNLHKYMTSLYFRNTAANNIRIYHRKVYIFSDNVLITILNLPQNLGAVCDKIQKRINGGDHK